MDLNDRMKKINAYLSNNMYSGRIIADLLVVVSTASRFPPTYCFRMPKCNVLKLTQLPTASTHIDSGAWK